MTARPHRYQGAAAITTSGEQAELGGLDLQAKIFGVDAALGEAACDEPKAGLWRAAEHVAQLLVVAKAPDRADAGRDVLAKQLADQMLRALVAGRQHDQIGG